MEHPSISTAVLALLPGAQLSVDDESYDGIIWLDERPQPSQKDVEAELSSQLARYENTEYQRLRAPEYPPLTDLADAVYWQAQGDDSKMQAYVAACEAVKEKYPKPDDSPGN